MSEQVSKIYWPIKCTGYPSGFVVGWNLRGFIACIATIVPDIELDELESILSEDLASEPSAAALFSQCNGPPIVLGEWNSSRKRGNSLNQRSSQDKIKHKRQTTHIWLNICKDSISGLPVLRDIHCAGYRYITQSQIIFYEKPQSKTHFYSERPIDLSITSHASSSTTKETEMEMTLHQVNASAFIAELLRKCIQKRKSTKNNSPTDDHCATKKLARSRFLRMLCLLPLRNALTRLLMEALVSAFIYFALLVRIWASAILYFMNLRLPQFFGGGPIYSLSSSGQQLYVRLSEFCMWPSQCMNLRRKHKNTPAARANHLRFYGSLCRIAVDMILGIIGCFLLYPNVHTVISSWNYIMKHYMVDVLRQHIFWLMGWPAGFKLNDNLDKVLGNMSLHGIDWWTGIVTFLTPLFPFAIRVIAFSGFFGASFMLALTSDLFALLTSHIFLFYLLSARLYSVQLQAVGTLWRLFRGKKKNVLRKRIDSCDYSIEQLLLGTVMFTLITFLFPTVMIYYISFAIVRLTIVITQAILGTIGGILNLFPMYPLYVLLTDPKSLPGGAWLERIEVDPEKRKRQDNHSVFKATIAFLIKTKQFIAKLFSKTTGSQPPQQQKLGSSSPIPHSSSQESLSESDDEDFSKVRIPHVHSSGSLSVATMESSKLYHRSPHPGSMSPDMTDTESDTDSVSSTASSPTSSYHQYSDPLLDLKRKQGRSKSLAPGLTFGLSIKTPPRRSQCIYFILQSQRMPVSSVFFQYRHIFTVLKQHYTPSDLLYFILHGLPVPQAPSFQSFTPPSELPPVLHFWLFLKVFIHRKFMKMLFHHNHDGET